MPSRLSNLARGELEHQPRGPAGGGEVRVGDLTPKETDYHFNYRLGVEIDAAGLVVWANAQRQGIELTRVAQGQQLILQFIAELEKIKR